MPDHALYYPEWGISDPVFLSEALLYWDRLAVIVPEEDLGPMPWHKDPAVQKVLDEAHERFVTGVAPTAEQKARAHEKIKEFAEIEPPEWCRPENLQPHRSQVMSAMKVAPETLNLLEDRGWMSSPFRSDRSDLRVISHAAANLILGKLADDADHRPCRQLPTTLVRSLRIAIYCSPNLGLEQVLRLGIAWCPNRNVPSKATMLS